MNNLDKAQFLKNTKVKTSSMAVSDGLIRHTENPVQVNYRLPLETVNWLRDNIKGNTGYAVSEMLKGAIRLVNAEMNQGEFNMREFESLINSYLDRSLDS